ncbi:hypothetical protein BTA30_12795 [Bacillus swezeyi]|uniref:Uncharacterized protein n=1 Tax=Bacillus swezeyi TaxID=1925020 RepID=A0A1R1RW79_9BACI|nr:hypothetical protein BW143_09075 [Bacillus swezeyi]OMI30233.1 hypothetical protein BTA30_12795 [Bacillus swezeyi]
MNQSSFTNCRHHIPLEAPCSLAEPSAGSGQLHLEAPSLRLFRLFSASFMHCLLMSPAFFSSCRSTWSSSPSSYCFASGCFNCRAARLSEINLNMRGCLYVLAISFHALSASAVLPFINKMLNMQSGRS